MDVQEMSATLESTASILIPNANARWMHLVFLLHI